MSRLVIISGCSGGGKSTLLDALAHHGYGVVDEPGRRIVRAEMPNGEALPWRSPEKFVARLIDVAKTDLAAIATPASGWTFFDRGLIDALVAHAQVTGARLTAPPEAARFNRLVFLAPPWREIYRTDAERQHSFEDAVSEYDRLAAAYPALGFETALLPKTDVASRVDFVRGALAARDVSS